MATTYTSPYATTFKAALKRGTSYNNAVWSIAQRWNVSPDQVWNSLYKAGLCFRQKFNGQWVYCPWDCKKKCSTTTQKFCQNNTWQWFCEWCLACGYCTPNAMYNHCGSQKEFMTFCKKFFGKQYVWSKKTTNRSRKFTKTGSKRKSYRFPTTVRRHAA